MHWLRRIFHKEQSEKHLDAELRFHLERQISDYVAAGMPHEEARRRAHLDFGGIEPVKEQVREAHFGNFLGTFIQDFRLGFRMIRKNAGFTAVAVLTLALGIGANAALFSILNALVLRDLPVPHPEELVRFGVHHPEDSYIALSLPMLEEISRDQNVFSETIAWWGDSILNVETNGTLTRADTWAVDGKFFSDLGAVPAIGRLLGPEDVDLKSSAPSRLAVLGYSFWQRHYGASLDIIGKTIKIEGLLFTIVGVTRDDFTGITADNPPEVIVPLTTEPLLSDEADVQKQLGRREALWIEAAGRLKAGLTLEQARAQLESLWPAIQKTLVPADDTPLQIAHFLGLRMKVESFSTGSSLLRTRFAKPLYVVLGIAGVLLLLTCANLAGLLLARSASRAHEIAVRVALGASRARLVRQMLTETLALSLAGTLVGFLFASWGSQLLASFILQQAYLIPARLNLSPDAHILEFTASAAVLTGILVGLAPAWRATREDPNIALQQSGQRFAAGSGSLGKSLIVMQIALSMILLAAAGLFLRSLEKLNAAQPGFRTRGVIAIGLRPRPGGYKNLPLATYYHELLDRVSHSPGVESAGMVRMTPGNSFEWTERVRPAGSNSDGVTADYVMLMTGSFAPLGIHLLQGRDFSWQDDDRAPRVVIVTKNFAEQLFPGCNPVGQHVEIATESKWQNFEIVGIASNASFYDLRNHEPFTLFVPTMQYGENMGYSDLIVQTNVSPLAIGEAVRHTVDSLGHETVFSIKTVRQLIDKTFLRERVTAMLCAFFGVLALALAVIGLYSLMAYSVTRRTREIGIRIALGARRNTVQRMVLCDGLKLAALGVVIGVPSALLAARLIAAMLFGLSPYDAPTFAIVVATLLTASALAACLPARRAMRVDPIVALRCE